MYSHVVPGGEDRSVPAVADCRELMECYAPQPPPKLPREEYTLLAHSFVSLTEFPNS